MRKERERFRDNNPCILRKNRWRISKPKCWSTDPFSSRSSGITTITRITCWIKKIHRKASKMLVRTFYTYSESLRGKRLLLKMVWCAYTGINAWEYFCTDVNCNWSWSSFITFRSQAIRNNSWNLLPHSRCFNLLRLNAAPHMGIIPPQQTGLHRINPECLWKSKNMPERLHIRYEFKSLWFRNMVGCWALCT